MRHSRKSNKNTFNFTHELLIGMVTVVATIAKSKTVLIIGNATDDEIDFNTLSEAEREEILEQTKEWRQYHIDMRRLYNDESSVVYQ